VKTAKEEGRQEILVLVRQAYDLCKEGESRKRLKKIVTLGEGLSTNTTPDQS
jgi:hypothetical protein